MKLFLAICLSMISYVVPGFSATVLMAFVEADEPMGPGKDESSGSLDENSLSRFFIRRLERDNSFGNSTATKAGLVFPVDRIKHDLSLLVTRLGIDGPIYLAAVLEHLSAEILVLAGQTVSHRINSHRILDTITNDEELNKFFGGVNMSTSASSKLKSKKKQRRSGKKQTKCKEKQTKIEEGTFDMAIQKVLKQVYPMLKISKRSVFIMNSFMDYAFGIIAQEAVKLAAHNKNATLSSREIQTAVRLLLPGELAKGAVSAGTKAIVKFSST